jgi:hypothetical protein
MEKLNVHYNLDEGEVRKITRNHLRLLILEEIKSMSPQRSEHKEGSVSLGWSVGFPEIDIPGFRYPGARHSFIRLERFGDLPSWWPSSDRVISLSGFSENYGSGKAFSDNLKTDLGALLAATLATLWGRLVKEVDWWHDTKGREDGLSEIPPPPGLTIDEFQRRIVEAFNSYGEGDTYQVFPEEAPGEAKNSNSLTFSILRRAMGGNFNVLMRRLGVNQRTYPGFAQQVSGI